MAFCRSESLAPSTFWRWRQKLAGADRPIGLGDPVSKASVSFLDELFDQIDATLERRPVLEMRMDGEFFRDDVIDVLDNEGVQYAISVPSWRWLGLKERIAECRYWGRM